MITPVTIDRAMVATPLLHDLDNIIILLPASCQSANTLRVPWCHQTCDDKTHGGGEAGHAPASTATCAVQTKENKAKEASWVQKETTPMIAARIRSGMGGDAFNGNAGYLRSQSLLAEPHVRVLFVHRWTIFDVFVQFCCTIVAWLQSRCNLGS